MSSNFLDQILKRMDETIGSINSKSKEAFLEEEDTADREKLILKFTRNNSDTPIVDCANEDEVSEDFEERCAWKVSNPKNMTIEERINSIKRKLNRDPSKTTFAGDHDHHDDADHDEKLLITLDDVANPSPKESTEQTRRPMDKDEVMRLCRPDYGCDPEIKTKQSKFLSDAELFKPCASTMKKRRVSSYSKSNEAQVGNSAVMQNASLKPNRVVNRNVAGFNKGKKSLREYVASQTGFRKLCSSNIKRSKPGPCSDRNFKAATMKRQLADKHFQLSSSKESSEQEDRERAYKKRRFVIEQYKLNKQMTKYTSDQKSGEPDFTCRAKTRPGCINRDPEKATQRSESLAHDAEKSLSSSAGRVSQSQTKDLKYEMSLKRFMDNTKTNLAKDQSSSSKLLGYVPLRSHKRKFESKIKNKLV